MSHAAELAQAAQKLCKDLSQLDFAEPTASIYNPLDYAWAAHQLYLKRYANSRKRVIFLGMNPGPYGMAQTGIPFGEIAAVRDWMGISCAIKKPQPEHPKRPIDGFACTRSEVSGRRLWGAFAECFSSAEAFFSEHFVVNFCPLVFMEAGGKNRTPDKLPRSEREPLEAACRAHLRRCVEILQPKYLVGVGRFAEIQAQQACAGLDVQVSRVLHPSPASPLANQGWAEKMTAEMQAAGIW